MLPRLGTAAGGEDAPWRRMLRQLAGGGDDDYFGGSTTLVVRPIAREPASAGDYRQWREAANGR